MTMPRSSIISAAPPAPSAPASARRQAHALQPADLCGSVDENEVGLVPARPRGDGLRGVAAPRARSDTRSPASARSAPPLRGDVGSRGSAARFPEEAEWVAVTRHPPVARNRAPRLRREISQLDHARL